MTADRLHGVRGVARIGLGLAALGRPGYIDLGRDRDLPDRSAEGLRRRSHAVLDAAWDAGVRYFDAARSYGRAEEFLGGWLAARPAAAGAVVGSKWGYTYTGGWRVDAEVHEVKDHGTAVYDRQVAETRALLGDRLDLYLVHSVTPDSPALTDRALHERLARLAAEGVTVGLSTSGPRQADAVRAALAVEVDGRPLFGAVQATYNVLEPSAGDALAQAGAAGWAVVVKEAMANGRLAAPDGPLAPLAGRTGLAPDTLALAWVLARPWVTVVLSGAVTTGQLASNLVAAGGQRVPADGADLAGLAESADGYWRHRASLPWT
ncbi:aldo/keto reductase [Streptomyces sp. SL13]|uniref:Aldo/keto reductase n=1 Tax=Streptantibioticus silvisoli TaxID=2705255 RepID=A0AA90H8C9_9ACTN|nr:aldo/keto reductase [Streptantibioticus silvisoli]MDI5972362.1 aldo/keto reductase [Streptantibioticus silvisoli]